MAAKLSRGSRLVMRESAEWRGEPEAYDQDFLVARGVFSSRPGPRGKGSSHRRRGGFAQGPRAVLKFCPSRQQVG
jgi:hypothetical protein